MTQQSEITLVSHPYAWEMMQARIDHAEVTGQPLIERPYWYQHTSGRLFHDIFGCLAWPTEISDNPEHNKPGYVAIVGVVRGSATPEHISPADAMFYMLAEFQSQDVKALFRKAVEL
ncbi:MAG: hypothetical protein L7F78_05185, partial [Syntrophales bacterium LBB04]|nr:hypothetical protein [Syntrophales bacterium LBB04]